MEVTDDGEPFYSVAAARAEWKELAAAMKALLDRLPKTMPSTRMARLALQTASCADAVSFEIEQVSAALLFEQDSTVLGLVFAHLDPKTLCRASMVRRQWRVAANAHELWATLCATHWPGLPYDGGVETVPEGGGSVWHKRLFMNCVIAQLRGFQVMRTTTSAQSHSVRDSSPARKTKLQFMIEVRYGDQLLFAGCAPAPRSTPGEETTVDTNHASQHCPLLLVDATADSMIAQPTDSAIRLDDDEIIGHDWEDARWEAFRR